MVIDLLENHTLYHSLHPLFEEAFLFLKNFDPNKSYPERIELNGTSLIALIEEREGRGREKAPLESHMRYIDIQYTVHGEEEMGWREKGSCQSIKNPYCSKKDIAFYEDAPIHWFPLPKNSFAIFFPEDAHAPLAGRGVIKKIVLKVLL